MKETFMNLKKTLSFGFFPDELPPVFSTKEFGSVVVDNKDAFRDSICKKSNCATQCFSYSSPKYGMGRRIMRVPDPMHFLNLCLVLDENWSRLEDEYRKSLISESSPVLFEKGQWAESTNPLSNFGEFNEKCILESYGSRFELVADVSKYYGSIYSHAIPWALEGKEKAQKNHNADTPGNNIDQAIRLCQNNETIGIPIGPYTSFVVSEIIGCHIDHEITKKYAKIKGKRFIDDYRFYFDDANEAQTFYYYLQDTLSQFRLDLNTLKTEIRHFPYSLEDPWVSDLKETSNSLIDGTKNEKETLVAFFSRAFEYSKQFPTSAVLLFALKRISNWTVKKDNYDVFEAILLRTLAVEPRSFPAVLSLLLSNFDRLDKEKVKEVLERIIDKNVRPRNGYELAWCLFSATALDISLSEECISKILEVRESLSTALIVNLVATGKQVLNPEHDLNEIVEKTTNWLTNYQISLDRKKAFKINSFGSLLMKKKVSFFEAIPKDKNELSAILINCSVRENNQYNASLT